MHTINVIVENKIARLKNPAEKIVCGNSDYVMNFSFDEEWSAYQVKTARFTFNGEYTDVVFSGNQCEVPVLQNVDAVFVGVYAGELHTTTPAFVNCEKSILCRHGTPKAPSEDVYGQLMEQLNNQTLQGEKGDTGEKGEKGEKGDTGATGQDGVSVTHSWNGTVLTVTSASGTSSADLKGEKGEKGEQGEQGEQGVQGEKGEQGIQGLTGASGKDGSDGQSAYEIAKKNGFAGTETEWLASLKGADGKDGTNGTNGKDGLDGASATHEWNGTILTVTSASGTSSADLKGEKGEQGIQGEKGDTGEKGEQGLQGEKGDTGATGADGYTPQKGVDYFTESEKQEIATLVAGLVASGMKLEFVADFVGYEGTGPYFPADGKGLVYILSVDFDYGMMNHAFKYGFIMMRVNAYSSTIYFDFSQADLIELGFTGLAGSDTPYSLTFDYTGCCTSNPFANLQMENGINNTQVHFNVYAIY